MKKMSRKLFVLCLVCIMTVGSSVLAYAGEVSPVVKDSKSGPIPSIGALEWEQPEGCKAFCVSVWNKGSEALRVSVVYPDGESEGCNLQPGENEVIIVDNNAPAGKYELDFNTPSGVISKETGEYGIKWSAEFIANNPASDGAVSPVTGVSNSGYIPVDGGIVWEQPDGHKAFRLSVWNKSSEALKITLVYPDGKMEECTLQSGVNKVIDVNNAAAVGKYEIDFITDSGVASGEYGVRWATESFVIDPGFVRALSPITSGKKQAGSIPIGSSVWEQSEDEKAFCVRVWNKGSEAMKITLIYPDGKKEERTLQPGVNKVIFLDNNAPVGEYKIDFSTSSDVVFGEYEVIWSTIPLS